MLCESSDSFDLSWSFFPMCKAFSGTWGSCKMPKCLTWSTGTFIAGYELGPSRPHHFPIHLHLVSLLPSRIILHPSWISFGLLAHYTVLCFIFLTLLHTYYSLSQKLPFLTISILYSRVTYILFLNEWQLADCKCIASSIHSILFVF